MYQNFESISPEKQRRVRDAAMHQIAKYGYRKTSAEEIARAAGIAKGMVFHYFGNKLGLFEYLVRYTRNYLQRILDQSGDLRLVSDYLDRYRIVMERKFRAYVEEPYLFELLVYLFTQPEALEESEQIAEDFESMLAMQTKAQEQILLEGEDVLWREDLGPERCKRLIHWMLEGYTQEVTAILRGRPLTEVDTEPLWRQGYQLVEDLKLLFYRQYGEEDQGDGKGR